jgi:uncharacterized membrane protein YgcG
MVLRTGKITLEYLGDRGTRTRHTIAALVAFFAVTLQAAAAETLPAYATADESIRGFVSSINGRDLTLRDERGFLAHVVLRDGTVINPTGIQLGAGQAVTVYGHADNAVFRASEIDASAASYPVPGAAVPYAVEPYAAYADPYDDFGFGYGYGYDYGYGPFFGTSLFIGFGDRGFHDRGRGGHDFGGRGSGGRGFSGSGGRGFSGGGSARGGGGRGR